MKKTVSLFLSAALLLVLCACGTSPASPGDASSTDTKFSVVATIFPLYDWTLRLTEDVSAADTALLMDSGVDMHSFQPSAAEIMRVASCDLFIYVGGESDAWVADALAEAVNPDMVALNLMDILGDLRREEERVEGMTPGEDEEEDAYDEHVWLSLKNARIFCAAIADALAALDPENADKYGENLNAYDAELTDLDARYQAAVDSAAYDTLLFGDRFPFLYLTEDYGLSYYAAFPGCSAETEASFQTVAFLSGKLDELSLPAVMVIDGSDSRIAQTIIDNTVDKSAAILTLDSMQSVTAADAAAGAGYVDIMDKNLTVLAQALNG